MAIHLTLLGGFELRCARKRVPLPMSAQRLLAFLALHDRPLLRVYVAGKLWTDSSEHQASANLRSSLWRLSRSGHSLVMATPSHVALADGVGVDVRHVLDATRQTLDRPDKHTSLFGGDFGGDLLPDWYDDWLEIERERLRQLRLHALEALADELLAQGRYGHAVEASLLAVRTDPLRESAHRLLIRIYLAEGNSCDAVRAYYGYARRLASELGLEPSAEMLEVVGKLADSGDGGVTTRQRGGDAETTVR